MAEEDGAERPRDESEPEDGEASEKSQGVIAGREEMLGKDHGEHAVDVEVVPLDERADRRRADDEAEALFAGRAATRRCFRYRHGPSPVSCETGFAVPRRRYFYFESRQHHSFNESTLAGVGPQCRLSGIAAP